MKKGLRGRICTKKGPLFGERRVGYIFALPREGRRGRNRNTGGEGN